MNRELKFRFWNKLARRFQPPSKYAIDGEGKLVVYDYEVGHYNDPIPFSQSCIVPQQYTGLKDKNGKEIYEGDIVSYEAGEPNRNDGSFYKSISEVKFENGAFWPRPMKEECEDSWYDYELKNICIIGNTFETPELLNVKQLLR